MAAARPGRGDSPRARVAHRGVHLLTAGLVLGLLGPAEPGGGLLTRTPQPCSGPLVAAHAHNDEDNRRPLTDAIEHGFTSVEADVWLVDGRLLVGHLATELTSSSPTLDQLYLDPLESRFARLGELGRLASRAHRVVLLLDIKSAPASTVPALSRVLDRHPGLVSDNALADGQAPVSVVVSSDQPGLDRAAVADPRLRLDHRMPGGSPADVVGPGQVGDWVSSQWSWHFRWHGVGPMPGDELSRLHAMVEAVHQRGQHLRFWGIPTLPGARENVWSQLVQARVDRISTDDLTALADFLRTQAGCGSSVGEHRRPARPREQPARR